jgi:hypothetical protein
LDIEATPLEFQSALNQSRVSSDTLQVMASFRAASLVTVRGQTKNFGGTKFGFINNIFSTSREFCYASPSKARYRIYSDTKSKDGPGPGRWFEQPYSGASLATLTGGQPDELVELTFKMEFLDFPLMIGPLADPVEDGTVASLDHVGGEDRFVMWLAVTDHAEDHIWLMQSRAWHVRWAGSFHTASRAFATTECAGADGPDALARPATATATLDLKEKVSSW